MHTQLLWPHWKSTRYKTDCTDYDPDASIKSYSNSVPESPAYDDAWHKQVESEVEEPHKADPPFNREEMNTALSIPTSKILNAPGDDEIRNILLIEELSDAQAMLSPY